MYKLLLCWRYLRTRWIALASVISVTLGVATMIVVNAVMAGFSHEMQTRIHGILSDLVFESHSLSGFQDPAWHMEEISRAAGDTIDGHDAHGGGARDAQLPGARPVGDPAGDVHRDRRGDARRRRATSAATSSTPPTGGSSRSTSATAATTRSTARPRRPAATRPALGGAGWPHRRMRVERERLWRERQAAQERAGGGPARPVDQQVDAVLAATAPADGDCG